MRPRQLMPCLLDSSVMAYQHKRDVVVTLNRGRLTALTRRTSYRIRLSNNRFRRFSLYRLTFSALSGPDGAISRALHAHAGGGGAPAACSDGSTSTNTCTDGSTTVTSQYGRPRKATPFARADGLTASSPSSGAASLSGPRGAAAGSGHRDPGGNCRHESETPQQPPVGRAAGAADKDGPPPHPPSRTHRWIGRLFDPTPRAAAPDHHKLRRPGPPPTNTSFHGITRRRSQQLKRRGGRPRAFPRGACQAACGDRSSPARLLPRRQRGTPQDGGPVFPNE